MSNVYYPLGRGEDMSEGEYALLAAYDDDEDKVTENYPEHLDAEIGFWETKDSDVIAITAMTDTHLRNALRWMRARALDGHPKYNELLDEQKRRRACFFETKPAHIL